MTLYVALMSQNASACPAHTANVWTQAQCRTSQRTHMSAHVNLDGLVSIAKKTQTNVPPARAFMEVGALKRAQMPTRAAATQYGKVTIVSCRWSCVLSAWIHIRRVSLKRIKTARQRTSASAMLGTLQSTMALRVHKSMTVHLHHVVCMVHAQTARAATTVIVRLDIVANIVRWTSMNALHCRARMMACASR